MFYSIHHSSPSTSTMYTSQQAERAQVLGNLLQVLLFVLIKFSVYLLFMFMPGRVAQSVGHLTRKSEVLGSIPGLATYFRFCFR